MVAQGRQVVSHERRVLIGSLELPESSVSARFYKGLPITVRRVVFFGRRKCSEMHEFPLFWKETMSGCFFGQLQ